MYLLILYLGGCHSFLYAWVGFDLPHALRDDLVGKLSKSITGTSTVRNRMLCHLFSRYTIWQSCPRMECQLSRNLRQLMLSHVVMNTSEYKHVQESTLIKDCKPIHLLPNVGQIKAVRVWLYTVCIYARPKVVRALLYTVWIYTVKVDITVRWYNGFRLVRIFFLEPEFY